MEHTEQTLKIRHFLDDSGRIIQLPKKHTLRVAVLHYLAEQFEPDRDYSEKEVNQLCDRWHTFHDYFILRRELVEEHLLAREPDGSRYWRIASTP